MLVHYVNTQKNRFFLHYKNHIYEYTKIEWIQINISIDSLIKVTPIEALSLFQKSHYKVKMPIGIIGTNKPTKKQYEISYNLGAKLAQIGFVCLCGGRAGIMQGVCEGSAKYKGISIGILPEDHIDNANEFVTIPIATGIGFARNYIIATSSFCLIAIGGGCGTLSEISFGFQLKKTVMAIESDIQLSELTHYDTIEQIINNLHILTFNLKKFTNE